MEKDTHVDLSSLADRWPSAYVAREKVGEFTGGMVSPRYIANLDCKGLGPNDSIIIGRKRAYPVDSLIAWLENRARRVR